MNTVYIYCDNKSNRLTFVLDVIFKHILFVDYKLVDKETFEKINSNPKINYSKETLKDSIQITPTNILFETSLKKQEIEISWIDEIPYFYKTSENNRFNFDILASIFYMVSRYEEYTATDLDSHGRFKAENSLAFKNGFLEKPIVNIWVKELKHAIEAENPSFKFQLTTYKYINSIDVDIAYAYKGKSKLLLVMSSLKSILKRDFYELKNKYLYFIKGIKDSYDTYEIIDTLNKKYNNKSLYFIQIGDYGKYDKNLKYSSKDFQALIKKLSLENSIGIHPSYQSNENPKLLKTEKNRLENILGTTITKSRQHYLKVSFPSTFENLISNGIQHDYTLGFPSKIGFRAGICNSFPFFNLAKNTSTDLTLHPFQVMDGTLNIYMKLSPKQANNKIKEIISSIKSVNGTFISLWHNSSLTDKNEWKNWKQVYVNMVALAKHN